MKTAATVLLLALALAGCGNPNGSSNPTRQTDQVPVPANTN